jgi:hypothetical protein
LLQSPPNFSLFGCPDRKSYLLSDSLLEYEALNQVEDTKKKAGQSSQYLNLDEHCLRTISLEQPPLSNEPALAGFDYHHMITMCLDLNFHLTIKPANQSADDIRT